MDLGFGPFDRDQVVTILPSDLAVLMVTVAASQASSPTARRYARLSVEPPQGTLFAPLHGAFNGSVAGLLTSWKEG